ncbi:winged helix-turn-helix domain-containing protein [Actinotalea sp. Marseille-Q4924]|uniref:winged helix-turn-helix domain-containing protein n=1 Tax=Actinotalea sp. Marseille-Q4924 TaxID=2866571 RepID=UPI001CE3F07D|nr:winged helix-turn-helix domain-containing protein [Actinotalea sp. Marseille-Q4924]
MTAVSTTMTGETAAAVGVVAVGPAPALAGVGVAGPAFALHVTVDPAAGPAATALLADVARRVLTAVEDAGPLVRSRSLLALTATGRLSSAVARVGDEIGAAAAPTAGRTVRAAVRETAWGVTSPEAMPAVETVPAAAEAARPEAGGPALVLDVDAREVTRGGVVVPLTYKELGLLEHLLRNPHRAVARDELLREVWRKSVTARTTRTIDVHVRRLREKLGGCLRIVTVRGVGYRWDPTPDVVLIGSGDAD